MSLIRAYRPLGALCWELSTYVAGPCLMTRVWTAAQDQSEGLARGTSTAIKAWLRRVRGIEVEVEVEEEEASDFS